LRFVFAGKNRLLSVPLRHVPGKAIAFVLAIAVPQFLNDFGQDRFDLDLR